MLPLYKLCWGSTELGVMGREKGGWMQQRLSKHVLGSRNQNWGLAWVQSKEMRSVTILMSTTTAGRAFPFVSPC